MNPLVLVVFGLACGLGMLATIVLASVYLAFAGNVTALIGVAISAGICAACALAYREASKD